MTVLSQKKVVKSALERIDSLESELPRLAMAINEVLTNNAKKISDLALVLDAVVQVLGQDVVDAKLAELQSVRVAKRLADARKKLGEAVEAGQLISTETVDTDSFVVATVAKEGDTESIQVPYSELKAEIRELLLGVGVGTSVELDGSTVTVNEIYKIVVQETPAEVVSGE